MTTPEGRTLTIEPLTTSLELLKEGRTLKHCLGANYDLHCSRGGTRIFSIKENNKPLATTELSYENYVWRVNQTRGYRNGAPDPDALDAAKSVAREYQQRWKSAAGHEKHQHWLQEPSTGRIKAAGPV